MADYTDSKGNIGAVFPSHAVDGQEFSRVEPLITADQLRRRFLLGVPLYSFMVDPVTGKRAEFTNEDLQDFIIRAVSEVELATSLDIFPMQIDEKHPYTNNFWNSWGWIKTHRRPISSVQELSFTPATGSSIFKVNLSWLEMSNAHRGQLNLVPMVPAVAATFVSTSNVGAAGSGYAYLTVLSGISWLPALVRVLYTTGFPEGNVPRSVNEAIGITAAIDILTSLLATSRSQSHSLSVDGLSQSQSISPQLFMTRLQFLTEKRDQIYNNIKNLYGMNLQMDYI